jgi:hypothetical protein
MGDITFTPDKNFLDRITIVENTLRDVDYKVDKIYDTIVGNEALGQEGVIMRLKKLEKENDKLKEFKNKLVGAFVAGGALWAILWELFKNVISSK